MDRNELASRVFVALAGGDWGNASGVNTPASSVALTAFQYADAFMDHAERIDARPVKPVATAPGPCPGEDARDDAEARRRLAQPPVAPAGLESSSRSAAQSGITGINPPGAIRDDAGAQPLGANAGSWPGDGDSNPSNPSTPVAPKSEAAKYEPRVGDVVELWAGSAKDIPWVVTDAESHNGSRGYVTLRSGIDGTDGCYPRDAVLYLRPATPSELAAAGLPSPEATRPTWVRYKKERPDEGDYDCRRVVRWNGDRPVVAVTGGTGTHEHGPDDWEPCSPPPAPVEPAKPGTVENMAAHLAWCAWCGTDGRSELPYDAFRAGYLAALAARGAP